MACRARRSRSRGREAGLRDVAGSLALRGGRYHLVGYDVWGTKWCNALEGGAHDRKENNRDESSAYHENRLSSVRPKTNPPGAVKLRIPFTQPLALAPAWWGRPPYTTSLETSG